MNKAQAFSKVCFVSDIVCLYDGAPVKYIGCNHQEDVKSPCTNNATSNHFHKNTHFQLINKQIK